MPNRCSHSVDNPQHPGCVAGPDGGNAEADPSCPEGACTLHCILFHWRKHAPQPGAVMGAVGMLINQRNAARERVAVLEATLKACGEVIAAEGHSDDCENDDYDPDILDCCSHAKISDILFKALSVE